MIALALTLASPRSYRNNRALVCYTYSMNQAEIESEGREIEEFERKGRSACAFIVVFMVAGIAALATYHTLSQSVCDRTLQFDIGSVDSRFSISREKVVSLAEQAAMVWGQPHSKPLFTYTPGARFKINLVYDSRQANADVEAKKAASIDATKANFDALQQQYDQQLVTYQSDSSAFNKSVANARSVGVTSSEYRALQVDQDKIQQEITNLNGLGDELNAIAKQLNLSIDKYNASAGQIIDRGVYDGKAINIYEFQSDDELRLTLAHEFGHALGLDHVSDPKAIMYYLMQNQDLKHLQLAPADNAELQVACRQSLVVTSIVSRFMHRSSQ